MTDPRYPIGTFSAPETITPQDLQSAIDAISALPSELRQAVRGLSNDQLDTPYRPEGWTVRQLVHHLADSHLAAVMRIRKALTEKEPDVELYEVNGWAELPDASHADVELSLALLEGLQKRWAMLARSLDESQWKRTFRHPKRGPVGIDWNVLLYAWHGRHHTAHILNLRERERW